MVGEVFLLHTEQVGPYYGHGDELHLNFNFPPLFAPWDAGKWRACIESTRHTLDPVGAWPTWVLSNHDQKRHRTRYGSEARARAAAVLLLGLRGTPFLYMGEELGLEDAEVPAERAVDPGGRDGCRAPIPWRRDPPHGWPAEPWLPFPPRAGERSVEALREERGGILHLYRRLLAARRDSAALRLGEMGFVDPLPDGVLAWRRVAGHDARTVAINFRSEPVALEAGAGLVVEVASDGRGEGEPFEGHLEADQAVVLR